MSASPLDGTLRRRPAARLFVHAVLVLACLGLCFPVLWMLLTLLKTIDQTMAYPPDFVPRPFAFGNYVEALTRIDLFTYTKNTLVACTLAALGTTLSSALVAYAFTRLEWAGKRVLFGVTLATMMVPFPVLMVPLYGVFKSFGWIGTLEPLWVPSFCGSAFNIFLLRQFFLRIPKELPEAMMLDGASELQIFRRVYLPLSKAPLAVVAFFQFAFTWNDFLGPLLFLSDKETFTLSAGLQFYQNQLGGTEWHYLMAAAFLTAVPLFLLFFVIGRLFFDGVGSLTHVDA